MSTGGAPLDNTPPSDTALAGTPVDDTPLNDAFSGVSVVRAGGKVRVLVSPEVDSTGEPAQVVLLVDTSGSMAHIDPLVLKAAVQRVLRHFATTRTPVSVLTYVCCA